MPDTTEPYGYIDMEIDRLKHEAQKARREAARLITVAEVHEENMLSLKLALNKQKEMDSD